MNLVVHLLHALLAMLPLLILSPEALLLLPQLFLSLLLFVPAGGESGAIYTQTEQQQVQDCNSSFKDVSADCHAVSRFSTSKSCSAMDAFS